MDYPVLVNPGKPSYASLHREGHEEENQRRPQLRAAKLRKTAAAGRQSRAARAPRTGNPRRRPRPPTPNRRSAGSRRNWRRRWRESRNCRPPPIPTSCSDIPNRRGFERELHRAIAYIKRYHASGALIVLDVDRLKPINDAFGHAAGDQVLKAIVPALLGQVRSSDVIGRLGGDEFALLLWNLSETDAKAKAAALEEAIDRLTFVFRGRTVTAGASAGVAMLGPHAEWPRAGRGRQRDVCAQGAAAARGVSVEANARRAERASANTMQLAQPAQIVRHVAEFPQQLRVAEFADHGIAGAAERDRADAAGAIATGSRRAAARSSGSGTPRRRPRPASRHRPAGMAMQRNR